MNEKETISQKMYLAMQQAAKDLKAENEKLKSQIEDLKMQLIIKEQMLREATK